MLKVKIITVGGIKEKYLRDAIAEYSNRISGFASVESVELKESLLPDDPNADQIKNALDTEAANILAAIPPRAMAA